MKRFFIFSLISIIVLAGGIGWFLPRHIEALIKKKIIAAARKKNINLGDFDVDLGWNHIGVKSLKLSGDGWESSINSISMNDWKIIHMLPPEINLGDIKVDGLHFQGTPPEFKHKKTPVEQSSEVKYKSIKVKGFWLDVTMKGFSLSCEDGNASYEPGKGGRALLQNVGFRGPRLPQYFVNSVNVDFDSPSRINSVSLSSIVWKLSRDLKLYTERVDITPQKSGVLGFSLDGHFLPRKGKVHAKGSITPSRKIAEAEITVQDASAGFLFPPSIPVTKKEDVKLDGKINMRFVSGIVKTRIHGVLSGLNFYHKGLAREKLKNLNLKLESEMVWNRETDVLNVLEAKLTHKKVSMYVLSEIKNFTGEKPVLDGRIKIDPTPCARVMESLPRELFPNVSQFRMKGTFSTDVKFHLDFGHPMEKNGVVLKGGVNLDKCRVTKAPPYFRTSRIRHDFGYSLREPGGQKIFVDVSENTDWYTPLDKISPYMIKAVLTTEDGRFYRHRGFITSEFSTALARNLDAGKFKYGASSISMQVVKNVFLKRRKTLSRKFEELFLTWYMERHVSKRRIMEIYLNIIELGPDIYGVTKASRHYFGKEPSLLTAKEAIFFASILPSPKKRYAYFCRGKVSQYWNRYLNNLLKIMKRRKRLTDEELENALKEEIIFDHADFAGKDRCFYKIRKFRGR